MPCMGARSGGAQSPDHSSNPRPTLLASARTELPDSAPKEKRQLSLAKKVLDEPEPESDVTEVWRDGQWVPKRPVASHRSMPQQDEEVSEAGANGKWIPQSQMMPKVPPIGHRDAQQPTARASFNPFVSPHVFGSLPQPRDQSLGDEPSRSKHLQDERSIRSSSRRSDKESEALVDGKWVPKSQVNREAPAHPARRGDDESEAFVDGKWVPVAQVTNQSPSRRERQLSQRSGSLQSPFISAGNDDSMCQVVSPPVQVLSQSKQHQSPGGQCALPFNPFQSPPAGQTLCSLPAGQTFDEGSEVLVQGAWVPRTSSIKPSDSVSQISQDSTADTPPRSQRSGQSHEKPPMLPYEQGDGVSEVLEDGRWTPKSQVKQLGNKDSPGSRRQQPLAECSRLSESNEAKQLGNKDSLGSHRQQPLAECSRLSESNEDVETEMWVDGRWTPKSQVKELGNKDSPSSRRQQPLAGAANFVVHKVVMYPWKEGWLALRHNDNGTYISRFGEGAPDDHLGLKLGDCLWAINGRYVEFLTQAEVEHVWKEENGKPMIQLEFK